MSYLLIYITEMYRDAKFMILNFCTFDPLSILDKGSKNLGEIQGSQFTLWNNDENFMFYTWNATLCTSSIRGINSLAGWNRFTSLPYEIQTESRTIYLVCKKKVQQNIKPLESNFAGNMRRNTYTKSQKSDTCWSVVDSLQFGWSLDTAFRTGPKMSIPWLPA